MPSLRFLDLIVPLTLVLGLLAVGCADPDRGSPSASTQADAPVGIASSSGAKGGLDSPAIAIGPFLDGVLPPHNPSSPASTDWRIVAAFPELDLPDTLVIAANPSNDKLYVGARHGVVSSFDIREDVDTTETFLDIRDRVAVVWDGGLLGMVFHPEFGSAGSPFGKSFYAFYTSHCLLDESRAAPDLTACDDSYPRETTNGFFGTYLRLSRFEVFDDTVTGDPNSEQILLNIRLYNGSHRGGGMAFGNDGLLYVTIGDQFREQTAQDIVDTLEGGTMRFAVDITDNGDGTWTCPAGSHQPRRVFDTTDEVSGQWYCIPDDNPWLSADGEVFEEYCSIGHRNPHRLARDPATDRLWSGEVGEATREEINIIECGNNYGWPFREGFTEGIRPEPDSYLGTLTDPVIDFTRDEAQAIIGGYVYRGTKFPTLEGLYLAGDYVTNRVWAIAFDEVTMTADKIYLADFPAGNLATWGQDNQGEVYLGDVASTGPLYKLDLIDDPTPDAPALLSELGAFRNLASLTPSDYWVPYGLNEPFWSDGAEKLRFAAVPNDGLRDTPAERVAFATEGPWAFPIGTVLMKHFSLPLDEGNPDATTRLETRFMVHGDDDTWYGLTYRWRADQTEADLLTVSETADYEIALEGGGTRTQTWHFPSRMECLTCHQANAGGALGPSTRQLNGDFTYDATGRTDNQLRTWSDLGMFDEVIDDTEIASFEAAPALSDVTASLQDRARSWIDSNCGYCHQPGGANAGFDARFTTPFEEQNFLWTGVRNDLGNPGTVVIYPSDRFRSALWQRIAAVGPIAMPPLAKSLADENAVDLLGEWINRLDPNTPRSGVTFEYYEIEELTALPDFDAFAPLSTGSVRNFDISVRQRGDDFAIRFSGFLFVESAGEYTFYTTSDDGSQLFIGGVQIVDNDGLHGPEEQSGMATLEAGYHEIVVTMFERALGQSLTVEWEGPATANTRRTIGDDLLFVNIPASQANGAPILDAPTLQENREGDAVSLLLLGEDPDSDVLYYDASDLPVGVSIDHQTGAITGTAEAAGSYDVVASVSDGPEVAVVSFDWLVSACGDRTVDPGESCDDGNTASGDGCSAGCEFETPGNGGGEAEGGSKGCAVGKDSAPVDPFVIALVVIGLAWRRSQLSKASR